MKQVSIMLVVIFSMLIFAGCANDESISPVAPTLSKENVSAKINTNISACVQEPSHGVGNYSDQDGRDEHECDNHDYENYKDDRCSLLPLITSVFPCSVKVGAPVQIIGKRFGSFMSLNRVYVGGKVATIISWTNTKILAKVPLGAKSTVCYIVVKCQRSNTLPIQIIESPQPSPLVITAIVPDSAFAGDTITVTGQGFGASQGPSSLTIGGIVASIVRWSVIEIQAIVPNGAQNTGCFVSVNSTSSNTAPFIVLVPPPPPNPVITSVTPDPVVWGAPITIIGQGFGTTQGTSSLIVGGSVATIISWSDTEIQATFIPSAPGVTTCDVIVGGISSNVVSFTITLPPDKIAPNSSDRHKVISTRGE